MVESKQLAQARPQEEDDNVSYLSYTSSEGGIVTEPMTLVGLSQDHEEAPQEDHEEEKKEEGKEDSSPHKDMPAQAIIEERQKKKAPFDYFAVRQRHKVQQMKKNHSVRRVPK